MTAMATISVSSTTVPTIQPMTERRASFSDLAEKNFWYMTWLPSMSSMVGNEELHGRMNVRLPST